MVENAITGTLKYVDSGSLVETFGPGNFICLSFASDNPKVAYPDIKVGIIPSEGTGYIPLDEDMIAVFKVDDKDVQTVNAKHGGVIEAYDISGLVCETE